MSFQFFKKTSVEEVSVKDEFYSLLHGSYKELAHGSVYVLRRVRRDENDKKITCQCVTKEVPEPDYNCLYCDGTGFYFDESGLVAYKSNSSIESMNVGAGVLSSGECYFYFKHQENPRTGDFILEPYYTEDGTIINPVKTKYFWRIKESYTFRADNLGRMEYIRCLCQLRPEGHE